MGSREALLLSFLETGKSVTCLYANENDPEERVS